MNIIEKLKAVDSIINDAIDIRKQLQKECPHPDMTAKYDGYSCPFDGSEYWVVLNCPDCSYHAIHQSEINGERNPEYYKHTHLRSK